MREIEKRSEQNTLGTATQTWAIFKLNSYEFYGFDFNDKFVILVDGIGKFIIGEKFVNCISIGAGYVVEYNTFAEAVDACNEKTRG